MMKHIVTVLVALAAALATVGCMGGGGDDLDAKDIATDTSGAAPLERQGAGAAEIGTAEMTPGISEEEAQARVGSALGDR